MKQIGIYFVAFWALATTFACQPKEQKTTETTQVASDKVEVYYFHGTRRCATCNAVENVTHETLKEFFAEELKSGKIVFQSLNIDEEENEAIAKRFQVSGKALLFISGDKKVDLTSVGFMNAKTKPEKLKEKTKETIEQMI